MNEEFKGSNLFLNIPVHVAYDEEVLKKPKAALLYGEINSMLNVTGKFYMSNNTIAKKLNVSRSTAIRYINLLKERGFIETENVTDEMTGAIKGRYISLPSNNNDTRVVAQEKLGWSHGRYEGSSTGYTQKEHINKTNNIYNNNINAIDPDEQRVFSKAEQIFNMTPLIIQDLKEDIKEHDVDLIIYAMEITARNAERVTYRYYQQVLTNWNKRGFKTVDDVKKYEEERAKRNSNKFNQRKTINTDDDNVGLNW